MDFNEYVLEALVREKLETAREAGARRAFVAAARRPRRALRARLGTALIALGERLAGPASTPPSCAPARTGHG